jgi:hypothetical protein
MSPARYELPPPPLVNPELDSRARLRTVHVSYSRLETPFHLSFPDLDVPAIGARPLSLADLEFAAPANHTEEASVESTGTQDAEDAPMAKPRRRHRWFFALSGLLFGVGIWLHTAGDDPNVEQTMSVISHAAEPARASIVRVLEHASSLRHVF